MPVDPPPPARTVAALTRADWLCGGFLVTLVLALLWPLASIGVDAHHDGAMLKPAMDVLSGQVLFRDSFSQYGLLTSYLQALALGISPTLLSLRILNVLTYAATLAVLYVAWRSFLPRSLALVAGLLYILFIPAYEKDHFEDAYTLLLPWSSVFAMFFQAVGLYALLQVINHREAKRWSLILGVACSCVFWCRQPVGLTMMASLAIIWPALYWTGWKPETSSWRVILGRLLGGGLLVNTVIFVGLAAHGALPEWWEQNIIWPSRWSQAIPWLEYFALMTWHPREAVLMGVLGLAVVAPVWVRQRRPDLPVMFLVTWYLVIAAVVAWQHDRVRHIMTVGPGGWHTWVLLVILVQCVASLAQTARRAPAVRPAGYHQTAVMAALVLASLHQFYPMPDYGHAFYALAIGFGLVVECVWRWSGVRAPVLAVSIAVGLLPTVQARIQAMPKVLGQPLVTLDRPALLRGMQVPAAQAASFREFANGMEAILRQAPDIPAAMIGNDALYLCVLNNLSNPSPYYVTWRGLAPLDRNVKRWQAIREIRPLMILQRARWEAVGGFYRENQYVPVMYIEREALEIAVPQEVADRLGLKAYGLASPASALSP